MLSVYLENKINQISLRSPSRVPYRTVRSPSRVPYRTELLPRAPKWQRTHVHLLLLLLLSALSWPGASDPAPYSCHPALTAGALGPLTPPPPPPPPLLLGGSVYGWWSLVASVEILGCSEPWVYSTLGSSESIGTLGSSENPPPSPLLLQMEVEEERGAGYGCLLRFFGYFLSRMSRW